MTDADLRELERRAEAAQDPALWRRFYDERRRLGLGLPSGEATWLAELPGRTTCVMATLDPRVGSEALREIELEWRRLGIEVRVRMRRRALHAEDAWRDLGPWQDVIPSPFNRTEGVAGFDLRVESDHPCGNCGGQGRLDGPFQRITGTTSTCLRCDGTGRVHPREPADLGAVVEIRAPEFLDQVIFLVERPEVPFTVRVPTPAVIPVRRALEIPVEGQPREIHGTETFQVQVNPDRVPGRWLWIRAERVSPRW